MFDIKKTWSVPSYLHAVSTAFIWLVCLVLGTLVVVGNASATLTVNSVTLNSVASVTVLSGATISVVASETNTSNSNWRSTRIRTTNTTTNAQITTCFNTPDHNGNGSYSETFDITAPATVGTYDVGVRAYTNNDCSGNSSTTYTLSNGIIVIAPPTVTTGAASALTTTGATLNGTVSSNSASTTVTFDYGLTTGYGNTVTATQSPLVAGASDSAVSAAVTGLACNTLYHFRAKGVNSAGTTNGSDLTFTTSTCPTVTSIILVNPNPTALPSVSWTVTFSKSVSGVSSNNFTLVNSGLGGTPTITGVSGSGTTWMVTASTGSGNGTLGLNMSNTTGVIPSVTNLPFTGQVYTIDKAAPTVSSINLVNPNPTALTSVSWTATFSKSVTGVDFTDFSLIQGGGVSDAAIASVTGSGTTWTVIASTGSGSGTLGLNLVDNDSILDTAGTPLGGLGTGNGSFTGQVYTVEKLTCFTDDFNRNTLNSTGYWSVANEGGTFTPTIVNRRRLRITDDSTGVSTMAALSQLFPAAGNKIVVEFDHYAYDGSGADGMCVVLSDASIAPLPGAFGGSLGYAPKQASAGGDTTHPGFAGGWLGVALDEYGNFSNPTEGRTGGPGQRPDSVAVRGSGSLYTGYAYLAGTNTLSPGIDNAGATSPAPGYRYRITIDHLDGVHAWTSVERNTGTAFATLITAFDAKTAVGQADVPTNWYLSFTGSTGAAVNIHEIDNLSVCSTQPQPLPTLDHVRILHDGSANTCAPETITLKACADAACSTLYLGAVTVNLTGITGATWSSDPISFTGGQETVTLRKTTAGTVTLGGTVTSPAATNTTAVCYNGATQSCSLTYTLTSACFDAVETGRAASTPIYTKLAGTAFSLEVLALASGFTGPVSIALVDPTAPSGNCGDFATGLTAEAAYTFTSGDNGRHAFNFNYPYAAQNVKVRIRNTSTNQSACSSDNFAIRPRQLTLATTTPLNPTATNTLRAGADFNLTAASGVTAGYTGTPTTDPTKITDHNAAAIGANTLTGAFAAATGVNAVGSFQYLDVGTITLNANAVLDATFTAVDQVTGLVGGVDHGAGGDCIADSVSNTASVGFYGCNIGGTALGPLGRFFPDHYEVTATLVAACNGFTYMNQPALGVTLSIQAMASAGATPLSRYTNGYLPRADFRVTGDNNGTPFDPLNNRLTPDLPAFVWTNGAYVGSGNYSFDRAANPDGPFDNFELRITVPDDDGAQITRLNGNPITGINTVPSPATRIRYGRLRLPNAFGPETAPLIMALRAEFFNGVAFVTNILDNCTSLPLNARIFLRNPATAGGVEQPGTTAMTIGTGATSAIMANAPFVSGDADLSFTAPGAGNVGFVDIRVDVSPYPWLQIDWNNDGGLDPNLNARANFGIYRGNDRIINWREIIR